MEFKMWGNTRAPGAIWVGEEKPTEEQVECMSLWLSRHREQSKREAEEYAIAYPAVRPDPEPMFWGCPDIPVCNMCECGVAHTGGIHSGWCPLKDGDDG